MTTTALPSIAERVAAGAALLDQHAPGWYQRIAIHELELSDCRDCVLGQLYGDYIVGINAVGAVNSVDLGFAGYFEFVDEDDDDNIDAEYSALTAAWRELIETRRAATDQPLQGDRGEAGRDVAMFLRIVAFVAAMLACFGNWESW